MNREEAAQGLDYEIETLENNISHPAFAAGVIEVWKHDLEALVMAQQALRRLDELERWAKAHMETIGHYGDPWGEELGVYNTMNALLRAIVDGSMTWPAKEKP